MDFPLRSPWLHQLDRKRPVVPLDHDAETGIAIIGSGIAGISTAYFLLRDTDRTVTILEADRVAHGATGHNAGQLVAEFERSFSSLVREFGIALAAAGHQAVRSAWELLDAMRSEMNLQTPVWRFTGYGALSDPAQVMDYLSDLLLRSEAGLETARTSWHLSGSRDWRYPRNTKDSTTGSRTPTSWHCLKPTTCATSPPIRTITAGA